MQTIDSVTDRDLPTTSGVFDRIETRMGQTGFLIACALFSFFLLQVVVTPTNLIKVLSGHPELAGDKLRFEDSYLPIAEDPFSASTPLYPQCRLRILAPLVAYVLQLQGMSSIIVPWIASLPTMYLALILVRRIVGPAWTLGFAILLATLHPFVIANLWPGYQDSWAIGMLLLAMVLRPWWAVLPCIFVGMLADERCISGAGLVLCWHWMHEDSRHALKLATLRFGAICGALGLWIAYGFWQLHHVNMTVSDITRDGTCSPSSYLQNIPNGFYLSFKAVWAIAVIGMYLIGKRNKVAAVIVTGMTLPPLIVSLPVADVSRVVSFAFPGIFVWLLAFRRYAPEWLTPVLVTVIIVNIISPTLTGVAEESRPFNSLPMTVMLYVARRYLGVEIPQ